MNVPDDPSDDLCDDPSAGAPATVAVAPADLAASTAMTALADRPGCYRGQLSAAWNYDTPAGGVMMTMGLRALLSEVERLGGPPWARLRSATAVFCATATEGSFDAKVEILRRGDRISQANVSLSQTELTTPALMVSAVVATDRSGPDHQAAMPVLPLPESSPDARDGAERNPHERFAIFDNFDVRIAQGPRWWIPGWDKTGPSYARWFRYRIPQRGADGELDPLSLPPILDTMTAALNATVGPPTAPFVAPSLSLTIQFHRMTWTPWLLVHAKVLSIDHGYASVAGEVWSESGELIATATQTMVPLSA